MLAAYSILVIPATWWAKVKTFIQISLVGVVLIYINLVKSLEYFDSPALELFSFDYRYYFNLMLWLTAVITVATGIDYIVKYSYMIKKVLK